MSGFPSWMNSRDEIGVITDEQELLLHKLLDANHYDQQTRLVLADYMEEYPTKVKCRTCSGSGFVGTVTLSDIKDFMVGQTVVETTGYGTVSKACPACDGDREVPDRRRQRMAAGYRAMATLNLSPEKESGDRWVWWDNVPGEGFCPVAWFAVISAARFPRGLSSGCESAAFRTRMDADEALAECWLDIDDVTRTKLLEVGYKPQLGQDGVPLDMGFALPTFAQDSEPVSADTPMDPVIEAALKRQSGIRLRPTGG